MSSDVKCPKCKSDQVTANKKGFSGKQAVAGAVLTGGIGLLAGTIGSNKVKITCLNCGHEFAPGQGAGSNHAIQKAKMQANPPVIGLLIMVTIVGFVFILLMYSC